jgi:hypothetical protein
MIREREKLCGPIFGHGAGNEKHPLRIRVLVLITEAPLLGPAIGHRARLVSGGGKKNRLQSFRAGTCNQRADEVLGGWPWTLLGERETLD